MLGIIQKAVKEKGSVSLRELALSLNIEISALEPMLEMLIRKNRIELIESGCRGKCCTNCSCSSREDMMIYRMILSED